MMRVSLCGLLKNAADQIDELSAHIREGTGFDPEDESAEDPAPGQADYYAFALRETATHAKETRAGKHAVREFAEFYCLAPSEDDAEQLAREADACGTL